MMIEWEHPHFLWCLAALPLVWAIVPAGRALHTHRARIVAAIIRTAVLVLLIFCLAQPFERRIERHTLPACVALIRDRSASVASAAKEAERIESELEKALASASKLIQLDFARGVTSREQNMPLDQNSTNIELALERARTELPVESVGAVVLITDGRATTGDAVAAAGRLQAQGTSVHVYPIGQEVPKGPRIVGIDPPPNPRLGQSARFVVRVRTGKNSSCNLLLLDGKGIEVDRSRQMLAPGEWAIALGAIPADIGFQNYVVVIAEADEASGHTASVAPLYVEGPPKVLVLDTIPAESQPLLGALAREHRRCELFPVKGIPEYGSLITYDAVILNDCSELNEVAQGDLARYVEETGGGLLFISGANVRVKEWHQGAVEELLPIEFLPEQVKVVQKSRPVHVCYVLDKSGSMGQPLSGTVAKIDMVKAAVQRSVNELPPNAVVSIVVFDSVTRVLVPPTPVSNWTSVSDQVDSLDADGGTVMDMAVEAGVKLLEQSDKRYMVLLTDGITNVAGGSSPDQRWNDLAARISNKNISLITVGVGQEVDRELLNRLAWSTRGSSFFCDSSDQIPKVFIAQAQTIKEQARATAVPFVPLAGPAFRLLNAIPASSFPRLADALPSEARPLAQVVLLTGKREPLLATWRRGLGAVTVFTSGAKSTWARDWSEWKDFARFWNHVLGWVLRAPNRVQADVRAVRDGRDIRLLVQAQDAQGRPAGGLRATGSLLNPRARDNPAAAFSWQEIKHGLYEARCTLPDDENCLCRIQLANQQGIVFTHSMLLNSEGQSELSETGPDMAALRAIADAGGGMLSPSAQEILAKLGKSRVRELVRMREFWPILLLAAVFLWLADVAVRRFSPDRSHKEHASADPPSHIAS